MPVRERERERDRQTDRQRERERERERLVIVRRVVLVVNFVKDAVVGSHIRKLYYVK